MTDAYSRSLLPCWQRSRTEKIFSRPDACGGQSRENLDDTLRGATSISLCIDLRGRPGAGLGVRSLTRRVRDVPAMAGRTRWTLVTWVEMVEA